MATGRAEASTRAGCACTCKSPRKAAELHALPWERLYHIHRGQAIPLATSTRTPFSRYTAMEAATPPPLRERPVRLLYALSNPSNLRAEGLRPIDVAQEIEAFRQALGDLRRNRLVEVTILPGRQGLAPAQRRRLDREGVPRSWTAPTTLEDLLRHLPGQHILHFLGHGFLRPAGGPARRGHGSALPGARGRDPAPRPRRDLVPRLAALAPLPHLVFLAACESRAKQSAAGAEHPFRRPGPQAGPGRRAGGGGHAGRGADGRRPPVDGRFLPPPPGARPRGPRAQRGARPVVRAGRRRLGDPRALFPAARRGSSFSRRARSAADEVVLRAPPPPDTFAGRTDELERLAAILRRDSGTEIRAAIQGMGGLGKSTLARALGRDLEGDFPGGVLWVDAGQAGRTYEAEETGHWGAHSTKQARCFTFYKPG